MTSNGHTSGNNKADRTCFFGKSLTLTDSSAISQYGCLVFVNKQFAHPPNFML